MPEIRVINPTMSTEPAKLRVCAYARVSSDSDDQLNSFYAQVKYYTDFIGKKPEWAFVDIYADEGLTGTRADKRDEFQRLLRDCRKGKIDRILTKSISRFSRNYRDCIRTIRELKEIGVEVIFEKEHINTGKISREMLVSILSEQAQEESISISGNMRLGYQMRMKKGNFITCSAPYGYTLSGRNLLVNEDEAKIVSRIFQSYLSGMGFYKIAAELSTEKIPKRDGTAKWRYNMISYILQNEKYVGDALLQKFFATDTLPFRKKRNLGQKDQYYVQNSHEAIIDKSVFEKARNLMAIKRGIYCPTADPQQYPLTRMIQCGECGSTYKRKVTRGTAYWVCYRHELSKDLCSMRQIPETEIYEAFVRLYNKLKHNYRAILIPVVEQLEALQDRGERNNSRIGDINKNIAKLNQQNLVLNTLKSKGYMDSAVFIEQTHKITHEIKKLQDAKRNMIDHDEDDQAISDIKDLITIVSAGSDFLTEFDKTLFHSIIGKVTAVSDEKIKFRLLGGVELTEPLKRGG